MTELPKEKAFYFFTSVGNYTGESARSLEEFMQKVKEIATTSLEFHLYREDFQRWIRDVLENGELAEELQKIRRLNLKGEWLRSKIHSAGLNFILRKKKRRMAKAPLKTGIPQS